MTTSTSTLERPDVREKLDNDDDTPKLFHYVKKSDIVKSAMGSGMVTALCGETFPVTKQAKPGSPVCPDCERLYSLMPK